MKSLSEFVTVRGEVAVSRMSEMDEYRNLSGEIAKLVSTAYSDGQGLLIARADDLFTRLSVLAAETGYRQGFADCRLLLGQTG